MKRMSYMKRLLADLAIAESHNREDLVESINATIEKHKEYKHNWYLARKNTIKIGLHNGQSK